MRVPSKSKNAPVDGPSGLRSTSSTSVSTTAGRYRTASSGPSANQRRLDDAAEPCSVDESDGALRAVRDGKLGLVEQLRRHIFEESDAVAFVVRLEHLGGEHVAATVTGAGFGVDAEFHGRDLRSVVAASDRSDVLAPHAPPPPVRAFEPAVVVARLPQERLADAGMREHEELTPGHR